MENIQWLKVAPIIFWTDVKNKNEIRNKEAEQIELKTTRWIIQNNSNMKNKSKEIAKNGILAEGNVQKKMKRRRTSKKQ